MNPRRLERAGRWSLGLLVAAAAVVVFLPALDNGFVRWDDGVYVLDNHWIRALKPENIRWMVTTSHAALWQPLTWLSFALDYRLWGLDPYFYHLENVVLHAVVAALFYVLCLRWLKSALAAALAALFFAVHPLRVESVAWVTERKDVLSGAFWLTALLAYLEAAEPGARRLRAWRALAALAFASSIGVKNVCMSLAAVLVAVEVYPLGRLPSDPRRWTDRRYRGVWRSLAPMLLISAAGAAAALLSANLAGALRSADHRGPAYRAGQVLAGGLFYLWKTAWPLRLAAYYAPRPWFGRWGWPLAACAAAASALVWVAWRCRRRWPAVPAALACYALTLAPMSGLVQNGMAYTACDRYSYLPCLGLALLFGKALERRPLVATVWLSALGWLSWSRCAVWKDTATLWRASAASAPSGFALGAEGVALIEAGKVKEGVASLEAAVAFDPSVAIDHANLGVAYANQGDMRRAMETWRRGFEIVAIPELHADLGVALSRGGATDLRRGADHLRSAVALSPDHADWRLAYADALARLGRRQEAEASYAEALAIDPGLGKAHNNWALLLESSGRPEEAARHYREALRLPGARAEANFDWGNLKLSQGRVAEAERHYREALRLAPRLARARVNLGNILARRGELRGAAAQFAEALKTDPRLKEAGVNLAAVRRALGP